MSAVMAAIKPQVFQKKEIPCLQPVPVSFVIKQDPTNSIGAAMNA
jgi:hypothetical protein